MSAKPKKKPIDYRDERLRSADLPWAITREMVESSPYQIMPQQTPEEHEALRLDLEANGVQDAIVFAEDGYPLDGHTRLLICLDENITDYPCIIKYGLTPQEKKDWVRRRHCARRHLSQEQKRQICREQLTDTPERSDRRIGEIVGMDHHTVARVRAELEATGGIEIVTDRRGKDGHKRDFSDRSATTKAARAEKTAAQVPSDEAPTVPQVTSGGVAVALSDAELPAPQVEQLEGDGCLLLAGTIGDIRRTLEPNSVRLVICDNPLVGRGKRGEKIPAKRQLTPAIRQHYEEVARLAAHVLVRDGALIAPVEGWALGEIISLIAPHVHLHEPLVHLSKSARFTGADFTSGCRVTLVFSHSAPRDDIRACEEYEFSNVGHESASMPDLAIVYSDYDETVLWLSPTVYEAQETISIERCLVATYPAGTDIVSEMDAIQGPQLDKPEQTGGEEAADPAAGCLPEGSSEAEPEVSSFVIPAKEGWQEPKPS